MTIARQVAHADRAASFVASVVSMRDIHSMESEWLGLCGRAGIHPSTSPLWVCAHMRHLASRTRFKLIEIEIIAVRNRYGVLIAVVPVEWTSVIIGSIGVTRWVRVGISSEVSEPGPLLIEAGCEAEVIRVIAGRLQERKPHAVFWTALREDSEELARVLDEPRATIDDEFATLTIALPSAWAVLERGLSRKLRRTLRTNYARLKAHSDDVSLQVAETPGAVAEALDTFMSLAERQTRTSALSRMHGTRVKQFLSAILFPLSRVGIARAFVLRVGAQIVALRFGFVSRDRLYLHLFADDPEFRRSGPLTVLTAEILRYAISHRISAVYLATGLLHYNLRWKPDASGYAAVTVWSNSKRGTGLRLIGALRRALQRGRRVLRSMVGAEVASRVRSLSPRSR